MYDEFLLMLSLLIVVFNVFYGLIAYVQLLIFKKVIFESIYLKFIIIAIVIFFGFYYFKLKKYKLKLAVNKKVMFSFLLWIAYSFISFLLLFRFNYGVTYTVFSFFAMLFYPALMLVYCVKSNNTIEINASIYDTICKILYGISIVIGIIGILQYKFNFQLFNSNNSDSYYKILSQSFYGSLRAIGFFNSALDFGTFFAIVLSLSLSRLLFKKINVLDIIVLCLSLVCIYISLTRNVYIFTIITIVTLIFIKFVKMTKERKINIYILRVLPFMYIFVVFVVLFKLYGTLTHFSNYSTQGMSNSMSLIYRINSWGSYFNKYIMKGNIFNVLFGYGLMQNDKFAVSKNIAIDNTYFSLLLYQGILGLILFLNFFARLWLYLVKNCLKQFNYFEIGIMGILSSFLVRSLFNVTFFGDYLLLICIFVILSNVNSKEKLVAEDRRVGFKLWKD